MLDNTKNETLLKTLNLLSGPWTMEIIWRLGKGGVMRFGELKEKTDGISARILTDRLRRLEDNGFVNRERFRTTPPTVNYELTEKGMSAYKIIENMQTISSN